MPNILIYIIVLTSLFTLQSCSLHSTNTPIAKITTTATHINDNFIQSKRENTTTGITIKKPLSQNIDSWQYLISQFSLSKNINNARINTQINWLLKHPKVISRIQKRAAPYLYDIINQVQQKGLPAEFALLPAIESGFKATAHSRAGASGLWQFIPSTGKRYGLKQNKWYDGRRDVHASTEAATRYLKDLKRINKDWLLALASYNLGQGNLNRAIRRNKAKHKATDFWSLKLPKETRLYVPKLLALAKVLTHAKHYGITLEKQVFQPSFARINIKNQLKITKAAELSNLSLAEFKRYNPAFKRHYTPKKTYNLLIPVNKVQTFADNLSRNYPNHKSEWLAPTATPDKKLYNFAKHAQVPLTPPLPLIKPSPRFYTVKSGDSLWLIARRLNLHSKDIARWNNIHLRTPLQKGKVLRVKPPATYTKNHLKTIKYTVRHGDSLFKISDKFKIKLTDLHKWNTLNAHQPLKTGQQLTLKIPVTPSS